MNTGGDSVYFPSFSVCAAKTCPFFIKPRRKTSQRSHQTAAGNKPHHADAPRTWMSLKRSPRRTRSGAAEPCCCWSPWNVTQHQLTSTQRKKNQQRIFKVCGKLPHHEVSDPKVELIDQQQREVDHLSFILGATEGFHVVFFLYTVFIV